MRKFLLMVVPGLMLAGVVHAGQVEMRPVVKETGPGTQELEYPAVRKKVLVSGTVILSAKDFLSAKADAHGGGYAMMDGSGEYAKVSITLTEEGAKKLRAATPEGSKAYAALQGSAEGFQERLTAFLEAPQIALVADGQVVATFACLPPDSPVLEMVGVKDLAAAEKVAKKISDALGVK